MTIIDPYFTNQPIATKPWMHENQALQFSAAGRTLALHRNAQGEPPRSAPGPALNAVVSEGWSMVGPWLVMFYD